MQIKKREKTSLNIIAKTVILVIFQKDYLNYIWNQNIKLNNFTKVFSILQELYQHFTNSIENYFSILKSRLQKLDGLTHAELKENITNTITNIPKDKYRNIIKGAYERPEKYVSNKNKTRKIKKNYL